MYCFKCGSKIPDDSKFCRVCGEKVTREEPAKVEIQIQKQSSKYARLVFAFISISLSLIAFIMAVVTLEVRDTELINCLLYISLFTLLAAVPFGVIGLVKGIAAKLKPCVIISAISLGLAFFTFMGPVIGQASNSPDYYTDEYETEYEDGEIQLNYGLEI